MRPSRACVVASFLVLGGALAASCFVEGFVTVEQGTPVGGGSPDASSDSDGAGGDASGCAHALWPAPPASADPGANTEDFVVAVRSIDFGERDTSSGPTVGYDLDNRCTCQGEGDSCREPDWATADHCDGPEGIDNATAQVFAQFAVFTDALGSEHNSAQAESGQWSLLIRVRDYNGRPNDDQVTLSLYPSPGLDKDPCLEPDATPRWDGTDRWPISAEALTGYVGGTGGAGGGGASGVGGCGGGGASPWDIDDARYTDPNAYVTDWTVVANLPEAGMVLASSGAITPLRITAGFVTARIEQNTTTGGWQLRDGVFTGRWRLSDFFAALGTIENSGQRLCTDHAIYILVKSQLCRYPDIASTLTGPTTPCDALSFAMGLTADPAQIGRVWATGAQPSTCPPGTDPADDECGP